MKTNSFHYHKASLLQIAQHLVSEITDIMDTRLCISFNDFSGYEAIWGFHTYKGLAGWMAYRSNLPIYAPDIMRLNGNLDDFRSVFSHGDSIIQNALGINGFELIFGIDNTRDYKQRLGWANKYLQSVAHTG